MSEGMIARRGGSKLFAVIAVTYPSGSICTCTNETKTIEARDTSGYALFNVKAGTYTVECHTSDNSKSKSISVTAAESDKGKSFPVTLTYSLVLFDNGSDNTAVTGGWTVSPNNGRLSITATTYSEGVGETSGSASLSNKTAIAMGDYTIIRFYNVSIDNQSATIGVSGATVRKAPGSYDYIDVDISNVSSGKVAMSTTAYSISGPSSASVSCTKIELI